MSAYFTLDGTIRATRYAGAGFGAPLTLADDPVAELYDGGAATQSPGGTLAVLWPAHRADGQKVLRLYASGDRGRTFAHYDGRPVRARTRLSALLHARPGSAHALVASVYARGVVRTLRLTVTGCDG